MDAEEAAKRKAEAAARGGFFMWRVGTCFFVSLEGGEGCNACCAASEWANCARPMLRVSALAEPCVVSRRQEPPNPRSPPPCCTRTSTTSCPLGPCAVCHRWREGKLPQDQGGGWVGVGGGGGQAPPLSKGSLAATRRGYSGSGSGARGRRPEGASDALVREYSAVRPSKWVGRPRWVDSAAPKGRVQQTCTPGRGGLFKHPALDSRLTQPGWHPPASVRPSPCCAGGQSPGRGGRRLCQACCTRRGRKPARRWAPCSRQQRRRVCAGCSGGFRLLPLNCMHCVVPGAWDGLRLPAASAALVCRL